MASTDKPYDPAYHKLFGHAQIVSELIHHFTPEEIHTALSPCDDMVALNARHHPTLGDRREGDRTFLVKQSGDPPAFLVRLEFQSTLDAHMDLRVALYNALLWQDLHAGEINPLAQEEGAAPSLTPLPRAQRGQHLPILPFVLYNGEKPWPRQPRPSLRQRVDVGGNLALQELQLDVSFLSIDIRRLKLPKQPRGPLDVLFALEQLRDDPADAATVLNHLLHFLPPAPQHISLREAFRRFILGVLLADGVTFTEASMQTLEDTVSNFATSIKKYREKSVKEGAQQTSQQLAGSYLAARLQRVLTPEENQQILLRISTPDDVLPLYLLQTPEEIEAWLHPEPAPTPNGKPAKNGRKKS